MGLGLGLIVKSNFSSSSSNRELFLVASLPNGLDDIAFLGLYVAVFSKFYELFFEGL